MTITTTHYGIHWAPGDIAFLEQERGGTNAVGARVPSPFRVKTIRKWPVNHLFGVNAVNPDRRHLDTLRTILERNSLARFLLPIPKVEGQGVMALHCDSHNEALLRLTCLLKMSNPVRMPLTWANLTNPKTVTDELQMTNVQPFVLMGVEPSHIVWVRDVVRASMTAPRKLLVVANKDVPFASVNSVDDTELTSRSLADLVALPWETLGSIILRAYMRKEWDGLWFTREPTPGNEAKFRADA